MENKSQIGHYFRLLTLFLCGTLLFLAGFFPASYSKAELDDTYLERPLYLDGIKLIPPPKQYDAFILFLIDGLRADFANDYSMPIAYSGACEKLLLQGNIPTVTMPRLKSITTGTLSNFIDIVLNVGYTEQLDDSILHRLKKRGDLISFAGDRTWIELFPSEFMRHAENLDSFFVNDFYKGDKNVTRVLEKELNQTDWTLLILHYLGLDHIGHAEGHRSEKINYKLKEMDEAINKILMHKNLTNYLLMVTADHGMANGGGHGGNTPEEIFVPLYLYSSNCTKSNQMKQYNQIDLAATLSILLSIEIPYVSIGCLIPEMLQSLSLEDQLYAYHYNAHHLLNRARIKFGRKEISKSDYYAWYLSAKSWHKNFLTTQRTEGTTSYVQYQNAKLDYIRVARDISNKLSESLVKFDYGFIFIGLALTISTTLHAVLRVLFLDIRTLLHLSDFKFKQIFISLFTALLLNIWLHYFQFLSTDTLLRSILLIMPITASIYLTYDVLRALFELLLPKTHHIKLCIPLPVPLLAAIIMHGFTLGSSSYIEYEKLTWYYLGSTLLLFTLLDTLHQRLTKANLPHAGRKLLTVASFYFWQQRKSFVMLLILTWLRHFHYPTTFQSFLVIFSLFILWARLCNSNTRAQKAFSLAVCISIYCFHALNFELIFYDMVSQENARRFVFPVLMLFWCFILVLALFGYSSALSQKTNYENSSHITLLYLLQTNLACLMFIAALLHKSHNIVLLPALLIVLDETYKLCDTYGSNRRSFSMRMVLLYKIVLTIFIGKMFHFYQGNSNSLATIDLNPGYLGQSSYNPIVVGIFVTLNTYCAQINSFLYLIVHILRIDLQTASIALYQPRFSEALETLVLPLYAALNMLPVALYLCHMVNFRYHLFIYSVFSPKVLYDCYNIFVFYLMFLLTSLYFKILQRDI